MKLFTFISFLMPLFLPLATRHPRTQDLSFAELKLEIASLEERVFYNIEKIPTLQGKDVVLYPIIYVHDGAINPLTFTSDNNHFHVAFRRIKKGIHSMYYLSSTLLVCDKNGLLLGTADATTFYPEFGKESVYTYTAQLFHSGKIDSAFQFWGNDIFTSVGIYCRRGTKVWLVEEKNSIIYMSELIKERDKLQIPYPPCLNP